MTALEGNRNKASPAGFRSGRVRKQKMAELRIRTTVRLRSSVALALSISRRHPPAPRRICRSRKKRCAGVGWRGRHGPPYTLTYANTARGAAGSCATETVRRITTFNVPAPATQAGSARRTPTPARPAPLGRQRPAAATAKHNGHLRRPNGFNQMPGRTSSQIVNTHRHR